MAVILWKKGMKVKLEKEPDNESTTKEAIQVKIKKRLGKIGYVANSLLLLKGESMSAGRL